jgi:hypothetical protein
MTRIRRTRNRVMRAVESPERWLDLPEKKRRRRVSLEGPAASPSMFHPTTSSRCPVLCVSVSKRKSVSKGLQARTDGARSGRS